MNTKISKTMMRKLLVIVIGIFAIIGIMLYVWNYYDIGINSSYQAKHDFTAAFQARHTGNCDDFVRWVSDEYDSEWKSLCLSEKNDGYGVAIISFDIQNIQISGDKAFLLVELQHGKREPYLVNYELVRYSKGLSSWWLLNQQVNYRNQN